MIRKYIKKWHVIILVVLAFLFLRSQFNYGNLVILLERASQDPVNMGPFFILGIFAMFLLAEVVAYIRWVRNLFAEKLRNRYKRFKKAREWTGADSLEVWVFVIKCLVGASLLTFFGGKLPLTWQWALWLVLGWWTIWNFPNVGLGYMEFQISRGIWNSWSERIADMISTVYNYIRYGGLRYIGAYLAIKLLLPNYVSVPVESAAFVWEIILLAFVVHFAWYFPYLGVSDLWDMFPKAWPEREKPQGRDIPAMISFSIKGEEAIISISRCTVLFKGYAVVTAVRGRQQQHDFKFEVSPEKPFETTVQLDKGSRQIYPLWYSHLTLTVTEPKEQVGARVFFPEMRGISQRRITQRVMELVYATPGTIKRILFW